MASKELIFSQKGYAIDVDKVEWCQFRKGAQREGMFRRMDNKQFVKAHGIYQLTIHVRLMYHSAKRSWRNRVVDVYVDLYATVKLKDETLIAIAQDLIAESDMFSWYDFYNKSYVVGSEQTFITFYEDRGLLSEAKECDATDLGYTIVSKKFIDQKGWGAT